MVANKLIFTCTYHLKLTALKVYTDIYRPASPAICTFTVLLRACTASGVLVATLLHSICKRV